MRRTTNSIAAGLVPFLCIAGSSLAQSTTTGCSTTFSLAWFDTGNHNGILEPGESALVAISVSFSNQNMPVQFAPPIGTFGSGIVRGFGAGFVDVIGSGLAQGTWDLDQQHGYGVNALWDISQNGNGRPASNGASVLGIAFGQYAVSPQTINTTNPALNLWVGLWTPASYAPRTVEFASRANPFVTPSAAVVVLALSNEIAASVNVSAGNLTFGSAQIPIVPSPPSALLLVIGIACGARRRRVVIR